MNSFAQPQAPVPVQQAPAPMQPAPWHSDVTSNFQTAYQTFNPVAADLHSGAVVPTPHPDYGNPNVSYAAPQQVQPQTAVAGRYSYAGGAVAAPQQQETQPAPMPVYGPPAPNFTPYTGGAANPAPAVQVWNGGQLAPQQYGPPQDYGQIPPPQPRVPGQAVWDPSYTMQPPNPFVQDNSLNSHRSDGPLYEGTGVSE